jgi:hypothetical protein
MRTAAGGETPAPPHDGNDRDHAIVSDLVSLIERVQASTKVIEAAIAREEASFGNQEFAGNVVVLDDVTPRYVRANAAMNSSEANLAAALRFLLDIRTPSPGTGEAGCARRPVRSIRRA